MSSPQDAASTEVKVDLMRARSVRIVVNERPVEVAPNPTGAAIKAAAISAGLKIDMRFQLLEELPDHRTRVVGDVEHVTVREGTRFVALAPDDNS